MGQSTAGGADAQFVVSRSLDAEFGLSGEWNDLWTRANGHYHQSFTVCHHCWEEIAQSCGQELFCVQARNGGRLVLVWPLVRYKKGFFRIIKPLAPSGGEANTILVDPEADALELARKALTVISDKTYCDLLYVPLLRVGSALDRVISMASYISSDPDAAPLARLSLENDWNSYRNSISSRNLKQMARSRRRILEMGSAKFFCIDPKDLPDQACRLIDWMLVEKQRWTTRTGKNHTWVGSSEYRNFIVRSVTDPREIQQYRLFAITVNNEPIAVKLIAICSGHLEYVIGAYSSDSQVAKLSPGAVLDEYWMRAIFDLRLDVDFGTGREAYKLLWAKGNGDQLQTYRIPITRKGRFLLSVYNQMRKLRARRSQKADLKPLLT